MEMVTRTFKYLCFQSECVGSAAVGGAVCILLPCHLDYVGEAVWVAWGHLCDSGASAFMAGLLHRAVGRWFPLVVSHNGLHSNPFSFL